MGNGLKMLGLPLLIGTLLVVAILTFFALEPTHPVPWIATIAMLGIPAFSKWRERQHFVTWKEEYSVGVTAMDEDHRKLLNLINHLQMAIHYHTGEAFEKEALDELIAYTRYHFQQEEALMQQHGYPELEAHKVQHREMITKAEEFVGQYQQQGHKALATVADYLKGWLLNHINGTDQGYASFLQGKSSG